MAEEESEETAHLRPACVACTFHCNKIHRDRNLEEEKYDPDRSWPFFRKKVSKLSVHQAPQSAICIPDAFMEDYPHTFQKGKVITLEGPSGNKWSVATVDKSVLYLGWRAFAHDHRLREGDQLHFNLTKPSHFVVDIFNSHGDVRRSARNARVTGKYSIVPRLSRSLQDQSRKRKVMDTGIPTIGNRCKTTEKRGNYDVEYTMGPRLKFSAKKKQWERHEERDGLEVVNLDTDDEEPKGLVKRHEKSSKIDRLVEFMREEEENGTLPGTTPSMIQVVNLADNKHQGIEEGHEAISGDSEENYVVHEQQENDDPLDEEDQIASNPLRQFTTMFDTKPRKTIAKIQVETPMIKTKKGMLDSESDPLSRQAQIISCEEDTVMTKEEQEETYLARVGQTDDVEVNTMKGTHGAAHVASSVSTSLPNSSPELHKFENKITVDCANEQRLQPQPSNPHVESLNVISPRNILFSAMEAYQKTGSPNQGIGEDQRNAASNKVLESNRIDPVEHAAADYEPMTNNADTHSNSSQVTLPTSTSAMPEINESKLGTMYSMTKDVKIAKVNGSRLQGNTQSEAGEFSFEKLENVVNVPTIDATIEGHKGSVHPLRQALVGQELAKELDPLKQNEEFHLTKTKGTEQEESVFQPTSPSEALKDCELHMTKIELRENTSTFPVSELTEGNQILQCTDGMSSQTPNEDISTAMTSSISSPVIGDIELQLKRGNEVEVTKKQTALEEVTVDDTEYTLECKEIAKFPDRAVTPDAAKEKEQNLNIQAGPTLLMKSDTDACVLMSKRGQVAQADRERALNLAQAWAKKLPNPNFIEVMKSTHVYTDFNMEIPARFWKESKLPPTDVRVTLVSEDPPSNCKAIWMPGNDLKNSKLNAEGWMKFSRTHFLEEGDVCVFEDLNNAGFRIGVYIFRVIKLKPPIVLDWERHYKVLETNPARAQTHTTNQARKTNGGEII